MNSYHAPELFSEPQRLATGGIISERVYLADEVDAEHNKDMAMMNMLNAEVLRLRKALEDLKEYLYDMPGGIIEDVDIHDTSPDDMIVHLSSICVRVINEALAPEKEKR